MSHNSCTITNSKANVFVNHARVSKLLMTKEDHDLNCLLKKRLNTPSINDESCSSMSEVLSAIQKMKRKGAAGPDNTPPTFLKSLGPLALQELLSIFNASFHHADCSQIWRGAIIIPLLKAGKLPSDIASFRPISLTSCVIKLLERIIADWLYCIPESNNLFSSFQAGLSEGRSCEDQILHLF